MDPERRDFERDDRDQPGDVESLLTGLAPARPKLDRDRVLYAAGERAGRAAARSRTLRIWQGLSLMLAVSTSVLSWQLATLPGVAPGPDRIDIAVDDQPPPTIDPDRVDEHPPEPAVREVVRAPNRVADIGTRPVSIDPEPARDVRPSYLAMRHLALTRGVDAIAGESSSGIGAGGDATYGHLRRTLAGPESL